MLRVFIGYDDRQPVAYTVLQHSILRRASRPVAITPLVIGQLPIRRSGLTPFSYSRFLVPWLCDFEGVALFLDADMLVLADIAELFAMIDDNAVLVVKHRMKFEWPSVMLFNCGHPDNRILSPEYVESSAELLSMNWTGKIGCLPEEWNHLVTYDEPKPAKLRHFTAGVPYFMETKDLGYGPEWTEELKTAMMALSWLDIMGRSVHAEPVAERPKLARLGAAPGAPQTAVATPPDQPTLTQVIKHSNTRLSTVLDPALATAIADWATRFDALPKRDLRNDINIVVFHVDVDAAQHVIAYRDVLLDHRAFDYARIVDHFIRMSTAFNAEARVILVTSEDSRMSFTHDRLTTIRLPIDSAALMFERVKAMCAYVRSTAFDRDSVFLDSDAFPNRSLKEAFSEPFDIGVTYREHNGLMPINEGAIYVAHRNLGAVQHIFRTYLATYAALIDDPVVRSYYGNIKPWRGGQLALNALCHRERTIDLPERIQTCGALVQFLPCDIYNFWILQGSRHTTSELDSKYVLHLKGLSKHLLNAVGRYQMARLAAR